MIRIIHAPIAALRRMCRRVPPQAIVIEPYTRFPLPWAGARAFLGELERRHGSEAIRHAVTPHRVLLSLVLQPLADDLTSAERREREHHGAQELGCMSHSRVISQALFEAWLGTLQPLVTGCVPAIVVPDAVRMDVESVVLLRHLMRRLPSAVQPDLVLGHDPTQAPTDPLWRRTADLIETQLSTLACLPGCVVETLADDPSATRVAPVPAPTFCTALDDRREERVFECLTASSVPSERVIREVLAEMRACFRAFGFVATLRLGLELLARCATLDHSAAAAVHALVALSAYNRKLEAGDAWLAEFLGQHFEVALALESDPARRSYLLYRLCINAGRRAGDLARAGALAHQAREAARHPAIPPGLAAYLEAWACNGQAYLHARANQLDAAYAECERAYARILEAASLGGVAPNELHASRYVFLDNLGETAMRRGDFALAARWQAALEESEAGLEEFMRISAHRWAMIHRARGELRAGIHQAEVGVAQAQRSQNPTTLDRYLVLLGDLRHRHGDARGAYEAYAASAALRSHLGEAEDVMRSRISQAAAALRAGLSDDAEALLNAVLAHPRYGRGAARAEVLAAAGEAAAQRGDAERAHERLNEAIAAAVASGERDVLVRVACAAGRVCLVFGRYDEAREAFARALKMADADLEATAGATDRLAALLGQWEAGDADPMLVRRAFLAAPAALQDAEAWWQLAHLVAALPAIAPISASDEALQAAVACVLRAHTERLDAGVVPPHLVDIAVEVLPC